MKKVMVTLICAAMILSAAGCSTNLSVNTKTTSTENTTASTTSDNTSSNSSNSTKTSSGEENYDLTFSDRDSDPSYDESTAVKITFNSKSASVSGKGATAEGSKVTITKEGTYVVSGASSDGQIYVKTDDKSKVQIVLSGVDLTSSTSPIVVESADKVFITLKDGTENKLSDSSSYELTADSSTVDAAIFSKSDLTINGTGKLTVNGNYKHGIVTKDDLAITGGKINVTSNKAGIEGKDSVIIKSSDITVNAGSDAIRSTNTEKTDTKGYVYIESGTFNLTTENDGIQAVSLLRIDGGEFTIKTGGGSTNGKTHSDGGMKMDMFKSDSDSTDSESAKAVKCATDIKINGGTFNIDSSDDAFHSNSNFAMTDGTLNIKTGDDGVHANSTLTIDGGTVNIEQSYEGIEAGEITVNNGNITVNSSDDGFNAAGGSDGNVEKGAFDSDSSKKLTINGGYVYVNADGDGLDSNGALAITGGVTLVTGPENNGNGALDYDSSATISGGTLVALGASGMAQTVTAEDNQGSIMTDIDSQSGKSFALTDSDGNVIASFNTDKTYSNIVVSSPDITSGKTYKIVCDGTVEGADKNGYANSGKVSGGSEVETVEMTSNNYSSGGEGNGMGGSGGGMGGPGRMNGDGSNDTNGRPDGDMGVRGFQR